MRHGESSHAKHFMPESPEEFLFFVVRIQDISCFLSRFFQTRPQLTRHENICNGNVQSESDGDGHGYGVWLGRA